MPATLKFEQVDELRERLSKAQAVFVSEYKGMTVGKITALRAKVRQAGGEMKVAKNTLFKIAMKEAGMASLPEEAIVGPNIYTIAYGDPVAVAKVLKEFVSEKTNKELEIKAGVLEKARLTSAQVIALADMPSKDVMIGMVVRTIAAPLTGLVTVLSGPIRSLATVLSQIKEQKEKAA